MPISTLINQIATLTAQISLLVAGVAALSWTIGSLLKGAPIPFRDIKEAGNELMTSAIRSLVMLSLWTSLVALATFVVSLIASAR
ncbi:MAG: hypothetical protein HY296_06070 [Thaumarchaeota archaeon]|nr:hypothetical protein [Nitrososphaerota archaeon]